MPQSRQTGPTVGIRALPRRISFEGLVAIERDGRPRPMLAERWSQSADGLSWQIELRSGVTFHDGSPMRADDVKASILTATKNSSTLGGPSLNDIVGIDTVGRLELRVRVRRRVPFLFSDLDVGVSKSDSKGQQIGTGPFYTVSQNTDEIVMTAHRSYYLGAPLVDRVVLRPYDTLRTAWASMMRGEVDFLWEVGQDALEFVQGESSVQVFSYLNPYVHAILFNARRAEFRDPQIRRALNLAVDRQAVLQQALKGRGIAAHLPIWPQEWAHDPNLPTYPHDPQGARALLQARLGGRRPAGTVATTLVRFTCLVPANFALYERIALLVQKQLYDAGVDMKLEAVPADVFNARMGKGDFDAVMLAPLAGPRVIRLYPFWHSSPQPSQLNPWGYADPAVDAALEAMQNAPDESAFREATSRFGRAMYQNPPGIFLAWPEVAQAVSRRFVVTVEPNRDAYYSIAQWRPVSTAGLKR